MGSGVFSSLLFNFSDTSKRTRSIVYILISVPYFFFIYVMVKEGYQKLLFFFVTGGVFYIVGALVYGSRFPNLVPGVFEYHELFHIFCILGFSTISISNFLLCKSGIPSLLTY